MARQSNQYKPSFDSSWVIPTHETTARASYVHVPSANGSTQFESAPPEDARLTDTKRQEISRAITTSTTEIGKEPSTTKSSVNEVNVQYKSIYPSRWTLHDKVTPSKSHPAPISDLSQKTSQQESQFTFLLSEGESSQSPKWPQKQLQRYMTPSTITSTTVASKIPWYKRIRVKTKKQRPQSASSPTLSNLVRQQPQDKPLLTSSSTTRDFSQQPQDQPQHLGRNERGSKVIYKEIYPPPNETKQRRQTRPVRATRNTSTLSSDGISEGSSHAYSDLPAKQPTIGSSYSDLYSDPSSLSYGRTLDYEGKLT